MPANGLGPRVAVVSARVLAYFQDPKRLVFREGSSGLGSIVGGKVPLIGVGPGETMTGERLFERVDQELLEETTLERDGVLRPLTTLFCPQRFIRYPVEKFAELGYDPTGIESDQEEVILWNPTVYVFACRVSGELPQVPVEGRRVYEIDLRRSGNERLVKKRHRAIVEAWCAHQDHGTAIAPIMEIYDESSKSRDQRSALQVAAS